LVDSLIAADSPTDSFITPYLQIFSPDSMLVIY